ISFSVRSIIASKRSFPFLSAQLSLRSAHFLFSALNYRFQALISFSERLIVASQPSFRFLGNQLSAISAQFLYRTLFSLQKIY
ncbi:MAG: hypothetical protein ACO1OC_07270, partial [Tuberibacillus sp.]